MKVGFTASAFDLLHPGHLHFLKECRKRCDKLVVGLHVDPSIERNGKSKPVQTLYERFIQLRYCPFVDMIAPYETELDLLNMLKTLSLDVRFLGSEYEHESDITGGDILPIEFIPRKHSYSSTDLRKRLK